MNLSKFYGPGARSHQQTDGWTDGRGAHLADFVLLAVVVDDRFGLVVERLQPLLDRLLVVIHATTRLSSLQQTTRHRLVRYVKVQHPDTWHDLQTQRALHYRR